MGFSITNFIVESPAYIKYLLFIGIITLDAGIETFTGASFTSGISWLIGQITNTPFVITAQQFLIVVLVIGALLVAIKLKGAKH